jgi:hypothetical protein
MINYYWFLDKSSIIIKDNLEKTEGELTLKHRPQEACPVGPSGPQKAVQPYLLRHDKGLSPSHVAQYTLAV